MSKQSNQRYRKEKDKIHQDRADIGSPAATSNKGSQGKNIYSREFDAPSRSGK